MNFLQNPISKTIILRHDVDRSALSAWRMASLEAELGIKGTYYFRAVPAAYDENIIKAIADLGHEIGYHYEDLSLVNGDWELGIRSFEKNLERLRRIVPVKTICMHGSPLSKFDNRLLWQKFDYRKYGIIGEPYLDIDFNEVLYLTDTGRRWDGDGVSIRDKASTSTEHGARGMGRNRQSAAHYAPCSMRHALRFRETFDIITAVEQGLLPDKIMLTIHPQRWHDRLIPWTKELVWQNAKNVVKAVVVKRRNLKGLKDL
ncbi:hypothetical protein L0Z72_00675 [candidate division KSB1 bacterium]|nr:hypothetical protein [candidate division KSB1 bacterium]